MEKLKFIPQGEDEAIEFYVLEQTRVAGRYYLLVTDSEEGDGEAWILRDSSADGDAEAVYEFVEDEDELNALSGSTGMEIKYKKLQQEKWVNRGVKLDGFLFKIMNKKEREISLEEFLSLSQALDEKFTPNELASIMRYQQENFGNTAREIEAYYRKNEKMGKKRLLSKLLSSDIAPEEKEERDKMVLLWLKSRDVKDGRYRRGN